MKFDIKNVFEKSRSYTSKKRNYQNWSLGELRRCYKIPLAISVGASALLGYHLISHRNDKEKKVEAGGQILTQLFSSSSPNSSTGLKERNQNHQTIHVRYSNLDLHSFGGSKEILDNLADIVRYLQNPEEFAKAGAQLPKGIILSGPPGVGKTLLAEAVAGHAGVPFILINSGELEQSQVGKTEELLREIFKVAEENAPCVLCFDELDSIATKRIDASQDLRNPVLLRYYNMQVNQLLTLLSKKQTEVIVMGTTNHFDSLDPAVIRPGRFDRHIALSLPSDKDRLDILQVLVKDKKLGSDVKLDQLVMISSGFSGAKLNTWVNEAALNAARAHKKHIELKHFDEARTRLEIGVARKTITDALVKRRIAAHEAGHAVVGHLLNSTLFKISTLQNGQRFGYTELISKGGLNPTEQDLLDNVCRLLAGRAAEILLNIRQAGSQDDLEKAKEIVRMMVIDEGMGRTLLGSSIEIEEILEEQLQRAVNLLEANRPAWEKVTEALVQRDELFQEQFLKLMNGEKIIDHQPSLISKMTGVFSSKSDQRDEGSVPLELPPKALRRDLREDPQLPVKFAKAFNFEPFQIQKVESTESEYVIHFKPFVRLEDLRTLSNMLRSEEIESKLIQENTGPSLRITEKLAFIQVINKRN